MKSTAAPLRQHAMDSILDLLAKGVRGASPANHRLPCSCWLGFNARADMFVPTAGR